MIVLILFIVQRCSKSIFAEPLRSALMQGGTWKSWNSPSQSSKVQPSTPVWLNKKTWCQIIMESIWKRCGKIHFQRIKAFEKKTEKKNMDSRKYPNYQHILLLWFKNPFPCLGAVPGKEKSTSGSIDGQYLGFHQNLAHTASPRCSQATQLSQSSMVS